MSTATQPRMHRVYRTIITFLYCAAFLPLTKYTPGAKEKPVTSLPAQS